MRATHSFDPRSGLWLPPKINDIRGATMLFRRRHPVTGQPVGRIVTLPSDEPIFSNAVGQTKYFDGSTAVGNAHYNSLTAAGAADGDFTTKRFIPSASPIFDGGALEPSVQLLSTTGGYTSNGPTVGIAYPVWNGTQRGATWHACAWEPSIPASKSFCFSYYFKLVGDPTALAIKFKRLITVGQAGGGAPQFNTHDSPFNSPPTPAVANIFQAYVNAYEDPTPNQGTQPTGPYLDTLVDGQWGRLTTLVRSNSAGGVYDGRMAMWLRGLKVIDVCLATVGITPPGGWKPWCALLQVQHLHVNDGPSTTSVAAIGGVETNGTGAITLTADVAGAHGWTE